MLLIYVRGGDLVKEGACRRYILFGLLMSAVSMALGLHFAAATRAGQNPARVAPRPALPLSPGPDLIIESVRIVPTYPNPGEPVDIEVVIKNVGDAKAQPVGDLIHHGRLRP